MSASPDRARPPLGFEPLLHGAILIDQRFQISVLLLGPVQRVLVRLQLALKSGQDLQIALRLSRQLAQVLIFKNA